MDMLRFIQPYEILGEVDYTTRKKVGFVIKMMQAGCRWTQGHLRNVHIDYQESFSDTELKVTMTVNVEELLRLIESETQREKSSNQKFH